MRDKQPNWALGFGSGSFLIVWLLGFAAGHALETVLYRASIAAALGAIVGLMVGYTLTGLKAMKREVEKGQRVDFTVSGAVEPAEPKGAATERTATVPEAAPPSPTEAFAPIDYKQAAKQVHSLLQE